MKTALTIEVKLDVAKVITAVAGLIMAIAYLSGHL
jgi:hypothetical protein